MAKTILKWEDTNTEQVGYKVRGQATLTNTPKAWPVIATLADPAARTYTMDAAATKMYYAIGAYDAKQETVSGEIALALPKAYLPVEEIAPLVAEITAVSGYDKGTAPTTGDMVDVTGMDAINSSAALVTAKDGKTYAFSPSGKVHRIDVADDGAVTVTQLFSGSSMTIGWVIQVPDGKLLVSASGTIGGQGFVGIASFDTETNTWAIEKTSDTDLGFNGASMKGALVGSVIYMTDFNGMDTTDRLTFMVYDPAAKTFTKYQQTIAGIGKPSNGLLARVGAYVCWIPESGPTAGTMLRIKIADHTLDKVTGSALTSDYGRRQCAPHNTVTPFILYGNGNFLELKETGAVEHTLASLFPDVANVSWPVGMSMRLSDGGYLFVSKYGAAALYISPKFDRAERIPGVPSGGFCFATEINGWIIGFGTGSTSVWRFGWGNGRPKISMPTAWYASQYNGQGRAG